MNEKKILTIALLVLLAFGFTSCFDEPEDEFQVEADVYYINKMVNGVWVHGTTYYVYGNQSMSSATVTTPLSGETIELKPAANFYNVMVNSPAEEDYTAFIPEQGNFQFEVTSEKGEVLYSSDEQDFENLEGAVIDSIGYDTGSFLVKVTWNKIDDCDGYYLKMFDAADELVFEGYGVGTDVTEFIVSEYYNTGNWEKEPVDGEDYSLLLQTFVYDNDATTSNASYNIKEVTLTDTTLTWQF